MICSIEYVKYLHKKLGGGLVFSQLRIYSISLCFHLQFAHFELINRCLIESKAGMQKSYQTYAQTVVKVHSYLREDRNFVLGFEERIYHFRN
jgi:hypothetical protein